MTYLRPLVAFLVLSTFLSPDGTGRIEASSPAPQPRLGINISGPKDYNTELPFVDVFRTSRPWISHKKRAHYGVGPPLSLDSNGWITRLGPGCWAEAFMCTIRGGHYPRGIYTVLYDGQGKLKVGGDATVISQQPNQMRIRVTAVRGFSLQLMATNPRNYVRNIRVIMPGFVNSYRTNPWNPQFLQRWQGIACLRFKDFMATDNSPISSWSERAQVSDATFWAKGVPVELVVDLANRLGADAWFCMPHQADDDYVENFATLVRDNLQPGLKAYIEYSNETWNGLYKQHSYAAKQGQDLGLGGKTAWDSAAYYTALRSVQIFQIWQNVFGGTHRLVRVLPSQAASRGISKRVVTFQDAYKQADALAIAPYISFRVHSGGELDDAVVSHWTMDQLFDYLRAESLPKSITWMQRSKEIADEHNLKLIAYEGGQSLFAFGPAVNNPALTQLFIAANTDPRMGQLYQAYYQAWEKAGGDLFNHFTSLAHWNQWGCWGMLQYQDDNPAQAPKFLASMEWAKSHGQNVNVPSTYPSSRPHP